jgi:hypothetical protein
LHFFFFNLSVIGTKERVNVKRTVQPMRRPCGRQTQMLTLLSLVITASPILTRIGGACLLPNIFLTRYRIAACLAESRPLPKWHLDTQLRHIDFDWLVEHFGDARVYAQASSRLDEDTTDASEDGLPEKPMKMRMFVNSLRGAAYPRYDYVKLLDDNWLMRPLRSLGVLVEKEIRDALTRRHLHLSGNVHWSLWVGAQGSVTSMHFDDQEFNCLLVLQGRKRVVLIDRAFVYDCTRPESNTGACWTGLDILTAPPPHAQELVLYPGEAVIIPNGQWHAVENLEATIAVGINEFDPSVSVPWRHKGTKTI